MAALEEILAHPAQLTLPPAPGLTPGQEAGLREDLEAALKEAPSGYRAIPWPPPLTPDEIRQLLSECVTVVRPGETLAVRVPWETRPVQVAEYQRYVEEAIETRAIPFRVLILAGEELSVVQQAPGE